MEKFRRNTLVFDGVTCVSNALDFLFGFKREERKTFNIKF